MMVQVVTVVPALERMFLFFGRQKSVVLLEMNVMWEDAVMVVGVVKLLGKEGLQIVY